MITVFLEDDISVGLSKGEFSHTDKNGGKVKLTVSKAKDLIKALQEKVDACDVMARPFNGKPHLSDKDQAVVDKGIKVSIISSDGTIKVSESKLLEMFVRD